MREIRPEEFIQWANDLGIGLDERYSEPRCLVYRPYRKMSRFWVIPETPDVWPFFVGHLLDGLEPWRSCRLWFRGGRWPNRITPNDINEEVAALFLGGVGISKEFVGAIEFDRQERDRLIAVAFVQMVFGSCVDDDLFIVPDHGRTILHVEHHEVIHASFGSKGAIRPFIKHMEARGFDLPTATPDATFKQPRWMKRGTLSPPTEDDA